MSISIARQSKDFQFKETVFTLSATPQKVTKPDPTRVALILSGNIMGPAFVSLSGNLVVSTGIEIPLGVNPLLLLFKDVGGFVQQELWGASPAGAKLYVLEVLYRPGYDEQPADIVPDAIVLGEE